MHSIDNAGRLLNVSDHWLSTLGYHRDEVIGRKSVEFLTPASCDHAEKIVLDASGRVARPLAVLTDVSERNRAQAALEPAHTDAVRAEAEAATRSKSEFLANMSHGIRTPMNGNARTTLHTFRGVAGNLSVTGIAALAGQMETALKEDRVATARALLPQLEASLNALVAAVPSAD